MSWLYRVCGDGHCFYIGVCVHVATFQPVSMKVNLVNIMVESSIFTHTHTALQYHIFTHTHTALQSQTQLIKTITFHIFYSWLPFVFTQ